mmetsp:Transcript_5434/g.9894  ORF Transcript_5434/g.9894 Transcript_5434/m.9894 type:complete len:659 (-) Transcript_5434:1478-3454(-)
MSNVCETSTRVLRWDGDKTKWHICEAKFLARGVDKHYKPYLTGDKKVPKKEDYDNAMKVEESKRNASQLETIIDYKLATKAYSDLILSIDGGTDMGEVAFSIVQTSVTDENPDGDCKKAWERLCNKYASKLMPAYNDLRKAFFNLRLKYDDQDPDVLITKLEKIRNRMNSISINGKTKVSETVLILHVLANLADAYAVPVQKLEGDMDTDPKSVTIETVRTKLNAQYLCIKKKARRNRRNQSTPAHDQALMAMADYIATMSQSEVAAFVKTFKGTCHKCGKYGHKGADCRGGKKADDGNDSSNDNGGNPGKKQFSGRCNNCGKWGHTRKFCKSLKQDTANLAQGGWEDDNQVSDYDCKSINKLGFVAVNQVAIDDCDDEPVSIPHQPPPMVYVMREEKKGNSIPWTELIPTYLNDMGSTTQSNESVDWVNHPIEESQESDSIPFVVPSDVDKLRVTSHGPGEAPSIEKVIEDILTTDQAVGTQVGKLEGEEVGPSGDELDQDFVGLYKESDGSYKTEEVCLGNQDCLFMNCALKNEEVSTQNPAADVKRWIQPVLMDISMPEEFNCEYISPRPKELETTHELACECDECLNKDAEYLLWYQDQEKRVKKKSILKQKCDALCDQQGGTDYSVPRKSMNRVTFHNNTSIWRYDPEQSEWY